MTQRWRTLVLVYPVLDARFGSGPQRGRAQRVMRREEREAVMAVVETVPAMVAEWSDGLAALDPFDVVEVRRSIRALSSSGGGRWWVGPREVRPELESVNGTGTTYDSVYALWPGGPAVPQCGWGCSVGPSDATFGAGFSSISTDHWATLASAPDPAQGYVHEWLHQVEAVYRSLGVSEAELPPLHDAAAFTSTRPLDEAPFGRSYAAFHDGGAGTWAPWYRDWMTGRLQPVEVARHEAPDRFENAAPVRLVDAAPIGLTPDRWGFRERTAVG